MSLSERLLLGLCRAPSSADTERIAAGSTASVDTALDEALEVFPDLPARIKGRRVLDFGCGLGMQSVALALRGAGEVLGVDINPRALEHGAELARTHGVEQRVRFAEQVGADDRGRFDVVLSLNSMEHFSDPEDVLQTMRSALQPQGELLVSFSPPWYAPYGGHMRYFTPLPWVHLLFSERTVMAVRRRFRNDGATRYEDVPGGLNRMSLAKFEALMRKQRLRPRLLRYDTVKGLPAVQRIPLARELLVNRVTCALQPEA
jgi:SAM-dependent methyltransferase